MASLEEQCEAKGIQMTRARRVLAQVLSSSEDHPDVPTLFKRASAIDPSISIPTVYRTVKLFEEVGLLEKHHFSTQSGTLQARYEPTMKGSHDHLVDIESGRVIEFQNEEIEALKERIAEELGYKLVDHRLELYAVPLKKGIEKA